MEIAKLILEYLKVLLWPGTFIVCLLAFRAEFRAAMARLSKAELPGGVSLGFEYETVRLSPQESRARVIQEVLPSKSDSTPALTTRRDGLGQVPIDNAAAPSQGYVIEQLAITKLEQILNQSVQRHVRFQKGNNSVVVDGVVQSKDGAPDKVLEVKWLRDPSVVGDLVRSISGLGELLRSYEEITGRHAQLNLLLVVPQRVKETVDALAPLKAALANTDSRVIILDYEVIGFGNETT